MIERTDHWLSRGQAGQAGPLSSDDDGMMSKSEVPDLGLLSCSPHRMTKDGRPRQRSRRAALGAGAGRSSSSSASIRSSHHLTLLTAVCVRAALCAVCVVGHGIDRSSSTTTTAAMAMKRIGCGGDSLCCFWCVPQADGATTTRSCSGNDDDGDSGYIG